MRFHVGAHFDYYKTKPHYKEMKHRAKSLIAVSLLCCSFALQAQEQIDYYNVDFSEGVPTEMTTYDLDGQTLHYTMIQAGFKHGLVSARIRAKTDMLQVRVVTRR